jgi:hypothetical protein
MLAVSSANLNHRHVITVTYLENSTNYKALHYVIWSTRGPCSVPSQSMCTLWWTDHKQFPSISALCGRYRPTRAPSTYQWRFIILATDSVIKQYYPGAVSLLISTTLNLHCSYWVTARLLKPPAQCKQYTQIQLVPPRGWDKDAHYHLFFKFIFGCSY